jgi:hypothetical protein
MSSYLKRRQSRQSREHDSVAKSGRTSETVPKTAQQLASTFATFIAPTTLIVGLLYYFGYIRSAALYTYFGLDLYALDLTSQDYLLRGVDALYVPLVSLLLIILGIVWTRRFLGRVVARSTHRRRLRVAAYCLAAFGGTIFLVGVLGIVVPDAALPLMTPLSIGLGVVLASLGVSHLLRSNSDNTRTSLTDLERPLGIVGSRHSSRSQPPDRASFVLLSGVVVLSLFWTANEYAQAYGRGRAETLSLQLTERPSVIVDTRDRLLPDAPRITETALEATGTYRYRYRGYRLLAQSDDTIFLIPEAWTPTSGAILAVPDNDLVRLQFRAP